ncbi:hypothetical protein ES705_31083 [subsurface metagenome]
MLIQVIQNTDSIDSLTQTTGQDQTGLFLLIAGSALIVTLIIWILIRQRENKQSRQTISKQPVPETKRPTPTDTKSKTVSTTKPKPTKKEQKTQGKKEPIATKTEKPKADKEKAKKDLPKSAKPKNFEAKPEEQSQPKYIGYNPINIFEQTEPYNFPYVIRPNHGCIIKFPRKGRTGRKGFKEDDFKTYLTQHFNNAFEIYNDRFITVKGSSKPYEPDFTFTDEKNGINIFLDIEIDEPYEGINDMASRKATHFQYADTKRNNAFKKRGWIVIRFAEIQVHQAPLQCCLFVADVIKSIHPKFEIPSALSKVREITPIKQWTKEEAKRWSKEKYREQYLGIDRFVVVPETEKLSEIQETELSKLIETEVEDEPPLIPPKDKPKVSANPKRDLVQSVIQNSKFLAFNYNGNRTVTKPNALNKDSFTAYCYLKNKELEFQLYQVQNPVIKETPFTVQETGPNLGLDSIRNIVNIAIKNGKFIRMTYSRAAWTEMKIDKETGEIILNETEAETTVRTISYIDFAVNVLTEEHIEQYNLRNEEYEYINAYCHKREDKRTFRFDRISEIAILNL